MNGHELIAEERVRQVLEETYDSEHDDGHTDGAIARAAACYAAGEPIFIETRHHAGSVSFSNPWPRRWHFKPTPDDRVRELVKAGALIAAEIDRRLRSPTTGEGR